MNGKNHMATGAALAVDGALVLASAASVSPAAGQALADAFLPWRAYPSGPAAAAAVSAACLGLYILGTVLPDVDNNGLASKWLHFSLPVAHRGWTHSIWAVFLFLGLSRAGYLPGVPGWAAYISWPLRYLALGMLAHDLMDAMSAAGWAMFYPLGKWRKYKGIVMKRGWTPNFYSSERPGSEEAFAGIVVLISVLCWGMWAYLRFFS